MAELSFEAMLLALETTRGTAIAAPTHRLPLSGTMTPAEDIFRPDESWGILAEYTRSKIVKRWVEWDASGGLDVNYAPLLFNMLVKGNVTSPTTPTGATSARLWTFAPSMTADDIETATFWFGDPNTQVFRSNYVYAEDFSISADAMGSDGVTMDVSGMGQMWTAVADPTVPAMSQGDLLIPGVMQVWLDTSGAIGTTEIIGSVASVEFSVTNNISTKYFNRNPTTTSSIPTYSRIGRGKRHAECTITFDFADTTIYDIWEDAGIVKLRVRLNGDFIETASSVDIYKYVEWDMYGVMSEPSWDELEGTNRGISFTIFSQYDATAGHDFQIKTMNTRTTL